MNIPYYENVFARWAADNGVIDCERVLLCIHFLCEDGTTGTYFLKTGTFTFNHG